MNFMFYDSDMDLRWFQVREITATYNLFEYVDDSSLPVEEVEDVEPVSGLYVDVSDNISYFVPMPFSNAEQMILSNVNNKLCVNESIEVLNTFDFCEKYKKFKDD